METLELSPLEFWNIARTSVDQARRLKEVRRRTVRVDD